ncbi:anoctamin-8-like [Watersipora subatra]|uniref:anoctamin-8-like n=1 Tax=Watersipora subatra TaxID=2589382 RepID=UPI00355C7880
MSASGLGTKLGYVHRKLTKIGSWTAESNKSSECDVVIQFPKNASTNTIDWLAGAITKSANGLVINICKHERTGLTNMLVSCSFQGLLKGAEEILLKKKLKDKHGGQLRDFFVEDSKMYEDVDRPSLFFTSQERQQVILHLINNIRLNHTDTIEGHVMLEGQAIVPRMVTLSLIRQIYPLHCQADLEELRKTWVFRFTSYQPLNKIKNYFGVHIGMYFAFLGHYTLALTVPAFLGVLIWMYSGISQEQDDINYVMFALVNIVWSTIYMELWKRREAELAFKWGTLDKQDDLIAEPRPLYTGELRTSPVTGRLEPYYSKAKRNLFFYTVSLPVMLLCYSVVVLICFNFFTFYDMIKARIDAGELPFLFKFVPSICLAVSVNIMDKIYGAIAIWLNNKENYRNEEEYKNQLIVKLMVFQSVNSFLSLFYTAFYIQDFERLRHQLTILFVVRQVVGNMKESLLTFFVSKSKQQLGAVGATSNIEILTKLRDDCVQAASQDRCKPRESDSDGAENKAGTVRHSDSSAEDSMGETADGADLMDETTDGADTESDIAESTNTGIITSANASIGVLQEHPDMAANGNTDMAANGNTDMVDNVGTEAARGDTADAVTDTVQQEGSKVSELTKTSSSPVGNLTQAESEGLMQKYEGTFEDYLEMVIQFSYVSWFSPVFPLAGFFALLNNVVEIRSDAFKICMSFQRPFGERARDIGAWKTVLEVMSLGTIVVHTALIGISGPMQRLFPLPTAHRLLLIIIMEHVVLAIKYSIRVAISEVPEWVSIEMAKLEFSRREALRLRLQEQLNDSTSKGSINHPASSM